MATGSGGEHAVAFLCGLGRGHQGPPGGCLTAVTPDGGPAQLRLAVDPITDEGAMS
jgi:hypothetical protein